MTAFYNAYKKKVLSPTGIDFLSDTIKVALMKTSYVPDFAAQEFYSQVSGQEVVGAGYTAGGQALTVKTVAQDNTNNRGVFDADNIYWPNATIQARGVLVYKDTGNPATSPLIGYFDFLEDKVSNGGTFTLQWQSVGIVLAE